MYRQIGAVKKGGPFLTVQYWKTCNQTSVTMASMMMGLLQHCKPAMKFLFLNAQYYYHMSKALIWNGFWKPSVMMHMVFTSI